LPQNLSPNCFVPSDYSVFSSSSSYKEPSNSTFVQPNVISNMVRPVSMTLCTNLQSSKPIASQQQPSPFDSLPLIYPPSKSPVQSQQSGVCEPAFFRDSSKSNSQDAGLGDLFHDILSFPQNGLDSQPLENIDASRIAPNMIQIRVNGTRGQINLLHRMTHCVVVVGKSPRTSTTIQKLGSIQSIRHQQFQLQMWDHTIHNYSHSCANILLPPQ